MSRTGCRLLCDVSNVYLSAHNMGYDAYAYLDGLPADAIGDLAASEGFALHQLRTEVQSLEDAFLDLTHDEESIR